MGNEQKLKQLPKRRIGVKENANVRRILMARPLCPIDDSPTVPRIVDGEKVEVPNPAYTGETNCQHEVDGAIGWWRTCEERGHDPYFSKRTVTLREPVYEVLPDGTEIETSAVKKRVRLTRINPVSVPAYTRIQSGRSPQINRVFKGFKSLTEVGYEEVCEFRNCEFPQTVKSRFGNFCGERHARLIGADVEIVMLEVKPNKRSIKNKQLQEIDVSPIADGRVLLQQPPDLDSEDAPRIESADVHATV